ncbi:hypothetical protein C8R45DRAFT_939496 [Mycena sanguinolenta]|nr:hypothetical protein C8R45DRAFT_939496 [Mycena sanguinolenta]
MKQSSHRLMVKFGRSNYGPFRGTEQKTMSWQCQCTQTRQLFGSCSGGCASTFWASVRETDARSCGEKQISPWVGKDSEAKKPKVVPTDRSGIRTAVDKMDDAGTDEDKRDTDRITPQ